MAAEVAMRQFTDAEMERSIASGVPMDKAGAYAIQDADFRPARLERGCYSNVIGAAGVPGCGAAGRGRMPVAGFEPGGSAGGVYGGLSV